ncbi:hypothetical protein G6F44_008975 [Rhizopus delemar]|nr:hypothetical protein G6F44_008975 [Rhizopus delemar]
MTSSGADSSSSPTKIDSTVSFSTSETPATNYLAKKWHRKLINEEQPLMRRPRSETVPTQQQHQLFHSSSSDAMPTLRNAPGSASIAPPFGSGIFNTITPWSDMSHTSTAADQQLSREDHHIASTFASLNLDEDRDNTRRTIHTSHSYSSLQLFAENQNDVQIKRPPSVMDLRFQGNRPRAMSAVDRHQSQETYPFQNIWRPSVEDNRRPYLRNSTSSADLLEAMTRQRKVATGAASPSPVIYDENYTNWENMASFETDLVDLSSSSSGQVPSRSLWVGQLDPTITKNELNNLFSKFGTIESIRILPDRECAFINYFGVEEALRARDALVNKMGCQLGNTTVKIGFGKLEAVLPLCVENTQEPTRALWIGNIPNTTTQTILGTIFSTFGAIESIRLLPHKNCGFVNFFNSEDAVRAKRALHNREIMGPGTGIVKIGFAKVPLLKAAEDESFVAEPKEQQQEMMMYMMNEMMNDPNMISAIIAERKMIMQDFGEDEKDGPIFQVLHLPEQYFHTIPAAPELGQSRKVDISKLRDIKKRMDTGHISVKELEVIAMECFDELVELCSGFIILEIQD